LAEDETAAAVADIENNAALSCVEEVRADFAVCVEHRDVIDVHVRGNIARTKLLRDQLFIGALGSKDAEVHHYGDLCAGPGFESTINGSPLGRFEVGCLDADDEAGKFLDHVGGSSGIHVTCVLFRWLGAHAATYDIQKGEDASLGAVDDAVFEVGKILVPGAAGVGDGGDAAAEREAVGVDTVVAIVGVDGSRPGVDVGVNVNEARSDIEAFGVDGFCRVSCGNVFLEGGDFVISNGDVANFVNVVFEVEDRSVLDEEVVF